MRSIATVILLLINLILVCVACSNTTPKEKPLVDPMESALPHGATLPGSTLSKEDQQKLANAKGIVATPLDVEELVNLIDRGSKSLNIFCLWRLNCKECDKLLKSLTTLKSEIDLEPGIMAIHHVNLDFLDEQDKVNSHIREMGLITNNYILTGLEEYENGRPYSTLFKGDLPVLVLVNNTDGIKLIYQQSFTFDELYAIISPLTI